MNPNFPGRRIALFVAVCVLLTAAMLGSVIAFASEPKEVAAENENKAASTTPVKPNPSQAAGAIAQGKALFGSQGCSSCHTFAPAGSKGTVGPDLDHLSANGQQANRGSMEQYTTESIVDPGAYLVPDYPNGVMPAHFASLRDKKIDALVAFLTSGS